MRASYITLALIGALTLVAGCTDGPRTAEQQAAIDRIKNRSGDSSVQVTQDGDQQTTVREGNTVTATHAGNPTFGTAKGEDGRKIVKANGDPIVSPAEETAEPVSNDTAPNNTAPDTTEKGEDRPIVIQPKEDADDVEVDNRDEDDEPLFGAN